MAVDAESNVLNGQSVRPGARFQNKILGLLIGVILAVQLLTFLVVEVAVGRSVTAQLGQELTVGERVWQQLFLSRSAQIAESVTVLAEDFGFRGAVASGDPATIESALTNHAARIGASAAWVQKTDGQQIASLASNDDGVGAAELQIFLDRARSEGIATGLLALGDRAFQVATVPVMAPHLVGWATVGLQIDADQMADFRDLTGLDSALMRVDGGRRVALASNVGAADIAWVLDQETGESAQFPVELSDQAFIARFVAFPAIGNQGFELLLLASAEQLLAPYVRLKWQVLAVSGLAALVALAVAALVGRSVSRPVAVLSGAAARVESGDYSRLAEVKGNDEFSALAGVFNRMQAGLAQREQRILYQASHDVLTGLPNRFMAIERLGEALQRTSTEDQSCAVLMLDLDRFKEINDTLGHEFGDSVLIEVSKRLRTVIRGDDLIARLGGDEFMALFECIDQDSALQRAHGICELIREPLELRQTTVALGASIGLAMFPEHGRSPEQLLRRADIAMYEAKQNQSRVSAYQSGHDESHLRQLRLMADLRRAIAEDELALYFQPKIDARSGLVRHAEALVRWRHPELGMIGPDEFIPLAERSGSIHALSRWVLDGALAQCRNWIDSGLNLSVAVNLSAMDLMDEGLVTDVLVCLERHRLMPGSLIVEVTESALMRDIKYAVGVLESLGDAGILIAIDDFGTGHSSLSQLKSLPVHELKIDKSFVMRLVQGSDDDVIVRSTIEIGHNMGLRVIAEGVETEDGLNLLRRYGCDMLQGFFFSPPLPADGFAQWCRDYVPMPDPVRQADLGSDIRDQYLHGRAAKERDA